MAKLSESEMAVAMQIARIKCKATIEAFEEAGVAAPAMPSDEEIRRMVLASADEETDEAK